ncbi:right-handed parallel beta-helix repeat-containing protein [Nostoc sp. WHI]|uniref:right-handed parallel beta-helix repeat-containing protein n=1 Tax=Nostoc sp. WHI TaxID=2650611 RepID=UPI0018C7DEBF|nr:right-handed parallel beta-helix repeat-containing protein [Nostoc sp. WHI]MBG1270619.1 right-handed parallel beta-helix repeat-containing protein [Nostoc sp. WHI]
MIIQGFSLSAYLAIPVVLSLLLEGEKIKVSVVENVPQVSANQEIIVSNRKPNSTKLTPKTYYVSGVGNDKNTGLSSSSAFRTIQKAADITKPGDTVLIMNGVYKNAQPNGQVVSITRSGTANAWIKFKAHPGHLPRLQHNGWHGILIHNGASYIEVNGLEVIGNNANVTLDYAMSEKTNKLNPLTNGNCIVVDGRKKGHTHHIRIVNNKVHGCGGAGIGVMESDYVTVDRNVVFDNAWYGVYAGSGISMLHNRALDSSQGYKMFVTNNKVYNNRQYIPWIKTKTVTDGNGIIIDDSRGTQINSPWGVYKGRTLVKNNLTFNNGGSGIHAYLSEHVDIVNNTAFLNNQSPEITGGQIFANASSDVKVLNNILYAFPGKNVNSKWKSTKVIYDYNIYINNSKVSFKGFNDIVANPEFIKEHPILEKISGDWKSQLSKQRQPTRNSIKATNFVCEPVTYSLKGKLIKVGCSNL